MLQTRLQLIAILIVVALNVGRPCEAEPQNTLAEDRAALYADYRAKLTDLAAWCDENKLADEGREVRAGCPKRNRNKTYLFVLDPLRQANSPVAPAGTDHASFARAGKNCDPNRRKRLDLARRAAAEQQPSLAVELVTEAAREDVDCKPAWRFLGYVKYAERWRTPFEVKQLGEGQSLERPLWLAAKSGTRSRTNRVSGSIAIAG